MKTISVKKSTYFFLVIVLLMLLAGCMEEVKNMKINDVNLAEIENGEYIGECNTKFIKAEVKGIVKNHKLVKVKILKHEHGRGKKAEKIVDTVVKEQTTKVDVVSGATGSSKVILKAIENALSKQELR